MSQIMKILNSAVTPIARNLHKWGPIIVARFACATLKGDECFAQRNYLCNLTTECLKYEKVNI